MAGNDSTSVGGFVDNTADTDDDGLGADELDAGETGDSVEGTAAERDVGPFADREDSEVQPAEEAAMHVIDEP